MALESKSAPSPRLVVAQRAERIDLAAVPFEPWPHWSALSPNTREFRDPDGDRTIRVVWSERLLPQAPSAIRADTVPEHINSYDVITALLEFPAPEGGREKLELIGGTISIRPETLYCPPTAPLPPRALSSNIVVNIAIHTDGPSGEPMIAIDEIEAILPVLECERPGSVLSERGEYRAEDGSIRELLETCWEHREGRPFPYPAVPRLPHALDLPACGTPWQAAAAPGVEIKPFVTLGGSGPDISVLRLSAGATIEDPQLGNHRLLIVVAGSASHVGHKLGPLGLVYAAPGQNLGTLTSDTGALIYSVAFAQKGTALASRMWMACAG